MSQGGHAPFAKSERRGRRRGWTLGEVDAAVSLGRDASYQIRDPRSLLHRIMDRASCKNQTIDIRFVFGALLVIAGYREYGNTMLRYQMKLKVPRMIPDYLVYLVEDSPSSLQNYLLGISFE